MSHMETHKHEWQDTVLCMPRTLGACVPAVSTMPWPFSPISARCSRHCIMTRAPMPKPISVTGRCPCTRSARVSANSFPALSACRVKCVAWAQTCLVQICGLRLSVLYRLIYYQLVSSTGRLPQEWSKEVPYATTVMCKHTLQHITLDQKHCEHWW